MFIDEFMSLYGLKLASTSAASLSEVSIASRSSPSCLFSVSNVLALFSAMLDRKFSGGGPANTSSKVKFSTSYILDASSFTFKYFA